VEVIFIGIIDISNIQSNCFFIDERDVVNVGHVWQSRLSQQSIGLSKVVFVGVVVGVVSRRVELRRSEVVQVTARHGTSEVAGSALVHLIELEFGFGFS
jgi:hypothetical protein